MSATDVGAVKAPRFGGAKHADDHNNWFRYREVLFQIHGVGLMGQVVIHRQLKRRYVLAFFPKLPPCLVASRLTPRRTKIAIDIVDHRWCRDLESGIFATRVHGRLLFSECACCGEFECSNQVPVQLGSHVEQNLVSRIT